MGKGFENEGGSRKNNPKEVFPAARGSGGTALSFRTEDRPSETMPAFMEPAKTNEKKPIGEWSVQELKTYVERAARELDTLKEHKGRPRSLFDVAHSNVIKAGVEPGALEAARRSVERLRDSITHDVYGVPRTQVSEAAVTDTLKLPPHAETEHAPETPDDLEVAPEALPERRPVISKRPVSLMRRMQEAIEQPRYQREEMEKGAGPDIPGLPKELEGRTDYDILLTRGGEIYYWRDGNKWKFHIPKDSAKAYLDNAQNRNAEHLEFTIGNSTRAEAVRTVDERLLDEHILDRDEEVRRQDSRYHQESPKAATWSDMFERWASVVDKWEDSIKRMGTWLSRSAMLGFLGVFAAQELPKVLEPVPAEKIGERVTGQQGESKGRIAESGEVTQQVKEVTPREVEKLGISAELWTPLVTTGGGTWEPSAELFAAAFKAAGIQDDGRLAVLGADLIKPYLRGTRLAHMTASASTIPTRIPGGKHINLKELFDAENVKVVTRLKQRVPTTAGYSEEEKEKMLRVIQFIAQEATK